MPRRGLLFHIRQVPPDIHEIRILREQVNYHRQRIGKDPGQVHLAGFFGDERKMFFWWRKLRVHIRPVAPGVHPVPAVLFEPDRIEAMQVEGRADIAMVFEALVTEPGRDPVCPEQGSKEVALCKTVAGRVLQNRGRKKSVTGFIL